MAKKERHATITAEKKRARKISVSITGDSGEDLDAFCKDEERSPSWTVNKLIERFLPKLRTRQ